MARIDKENYYLDIAETVAERGTCLRRNFGAIIVNKDQIISTGYVGAPRGRRNCIDLGYCVRESLQIPRGERYELCRSVHAEANAIIHASRNDTLGGTLYLVGKRMIINAGIVRVIIRNTKDSFTSVNVDDWIYNDESLTGTRGY